MKGFDAFAGVIKSGVQRRQRAAKMVILNVDHPDINEFIECKQKEEAKAWALIEHGYDGSGPDSDAYSSVFFQNANNSRARYRRLHVRGHARTAPGVLHPRGEGRSSRPATFKAEGPAEQRYLRRHLGIAVIPACSTSTTVNRWHTSKNTARINASNPCSEYMFLDDSACNLASLNLLEVRAQRDVRRGSLSPCLRHHRHHRARDPGRQQRLPDRGRSARNSARLSTSARLLGYANLGALLGMASGLPYDSDAGRDYAACTVTAIMCGEAYLQSSKIAEFCQPLDPATDPVSNGNSRVPHPRRLLLATGWGNQGGACPGWYVNREPFLDVIRMHRASVNNINRTSVPAALYEASKDTWDEALKNGEKFGYRNAQVTVLAPTGTIGFMMDCDTTGIEPDLALVEVQEAGWRRHDQDCQQHRARRAVQAGLHGRPDQRHRQLHRRHRHY